jgi:hypothetical protein
VAALLEMLAGAAAVLDHFNSRRQPVLMSVTRDALHSKVLKAIHLVCVT